MGHLPQITGAELLLSQTDWVRRLARTLVEDPAWAEDLAQETLLTALERPPVCAHGERSLRTWLARVLRNRIRLGRRGELRRRARERAAAQPERLASTSYVVERAAIHRAVVDAVLALEEPYRSAVLLRYFDGLSVSRLAERVSIRPEAARKRVSRGLAMLRARLEREHGGRARGPTEALALLAFGREGTGALATVLSMGMVMSAKGKLMVAAGLVLAFALVLVRGSLVNGTAHPLDQAGKGEAALSAETEDGPAAAETAEEVAAGARVSLDRPAMDPGVVLRVVSGEEEAPLPGAEVLIATPRTREELEARVEEHWSELGIATEAQRWLGLVSESAIPPDPTDPERPPFVPGATELLGETDGAGLLELARLPLAGGGLVVRHPSRFPMLVPAAGLAVEPGGEVQVAMPSRGVLRVEVLDSIGEPVEGAFARLELDFSSILSVGAPRPLLDPLCWHGPTGPAGILVVRDLPAGTRLYATALGQFSGRSRGCRIDPSAGAGECVLVVWRLGSVKGRLLWQDGSPAADLSIGFRGPWALTSLSNRGTKSGEEGAFLLEDQVAGLGELQVKHARWAPYPLHQIPLEIRAGELVDVGSIELAELGRIEGRVLLPGPIDPGTMEIVLHRDGETRSMHGVLAEGRFSCQVPRGDYELTLYQHTSWWRPRLLSMPVRCPSSDVEVPVLDRMGSLRARLPEGMPDEVPVAVRMIGDPMFWDVPGWTLSGAMFRTDASVHDGLLELTLIPPGEYTAEVSLGDFGIARQASVVIRAGAATDLGELDISAAELSGRTLDASGAPLPGARVILLAPSFDGVGQGERLRRETVSDTEGHYRLRLLVPRRWTAWAQVGTEAVSAPRPVDLLSGESAERDFRLHAPCFVRGRITRHGEPEAGVEVGWSYGGLADLKLTIGAAPSVWSDEEGRYQLGPFLPGSYRVRVKGSPLRMRPVRFEPGRDEHMDFELQSDLHLLQLERRGEPLRHVELVSAVCIDATSPLFGASNYGSLRGGGRVEIQIPPAAVVLEARIGGASNEGYMQAVVDGARLGDVATVAFPVGEIELRLPPHRGHMERPEVYLLAVPEGDLVSAFSGRPAPLPREEVDGAVRYLGIPAGARLLLEGPDESGRMASREILYQGPGVQRVEWP